MLFWLSLFLGSVAVIHYFVFDLGLIVEALIQFLRTKKPLVLTELEKEHLKGKVILVTGGNRTLGLQTTLKLLNGGAKVFIASKSAIPSEEFSSELQGHIDKKNLSFLALDLADFSSITNAVKKLVEDKIVLDVVVLNAGVFMAKLTFTAQKLEATTGVNFMGHFLFVNGLLKNRVTIDSPRILFVASEAHRTGIDLSSVDPQDHTPYGLLQSSQKYSNSKIAVVGFQQELAKRLARHPIYKNATVVAMCPGPVKTNIINQGGPVAQFVVSILMKYFFAEPKIAAEPIYYLAACESLANGSYYHTWQQKPPRVDALDEKKTAELWEKGVRIALSNGIDPSFLL